MNWEYEEQRLQSLNWQAFIAAIAVVALIAWSCTAMKNEREANQAAARTNTFQQNITKGKP